VRVGLVTAKAVEIAECAEASETGVGDLLVVLTDVGFVAGGRLDASPVDSGFDVREALETPGSVGDLFDEVVVESVEGPDVGPECFEFVLVFGRVFAGDDRVPGAQAVLEVVLGAALFAFVGARTGGVFCFLVVMGLEPFLGAVCAPEIERPKRCSVSRKDAKSQRALERNRAHLRPGSTEGS